MQHHNYCFYKIGTLVIEQKKCVPHPCAHHHFLHSQQYCIFYPTIWSEHNLGLWFLPFHDTTFSWFPSPCQSAEITIRKMGDTALFFIKYLMFAFSDSLSFMKQCCICKPLTERFFTLGKTRLWPQCYPTACFISNIHYNPVSAWVYLFHQIW